MNGFYKLQSDDRVLNMMQDNIAKTLFPITKNELLNGQILTNVILASGANTIPHGLGRNLLGWYLVRIRASATVYDTQDLNTQPGSTLLLTASGAVTVDIAVF